jgi:hypothetical protein
MFQNSTVMLFSLLAFTSAKVQQPNAEKAAASQTFSKPHAARLIDKEATKETIALYGNLKKLLQKGVLFGHQADLAYGMNWKYEPGRSDIRDVTGDYPARHKIKWNKNICTV